MFICGEISSGPLLSAWYWCSTDDVDQQSSILCAYVCNIFSINSSCNITSIYPIQLIVKTHWSDRCSATICRCCTNCGLFLLTATVKQCCWVLGFQWKIWVAVYWVHVGSAFLICALPTVRPVSNLALQRFLSPGQRHLFHRMSISFTVNCSRCAGCGIAPNQPDPALFHWSLFFFSVFFYSSIWFFILPRSHSLSFLSLSLSLTLFLSLSSRCWGPCHATAPSFSTKVRS